MKIKNNKNLVFLDRIRTGEVFRIDNNVYMKIFPQNHFNCVCLNEGVVEHLENCQVECFEDATLFLGGE